MTTHLHTCRSSTLKRVTVCAAATTLLLSAFALLAGRRAQASAPAAALSDVQSVYIFDFAKFVRWPQPTDNGPLTICVAAPKVYVDSLTRVVTGETVSGRTLAVRPVEAPAELPGCGILFIGSAAKDRLPTLLAAADSKPILTVSDIPGFLDRGGMVEFLVIDSRVRFSVNLRPAERGSLSLSSELLKVAVTVNGAPPRGGRP